MSAIIKFLLSKKDTIQKALKPTKKKLTPRETIALESLITTKSAASLVEAIKKNKNLQIASVNNIQRIRKIDPLIVTPKNKDTIFLYRGVALDDSLPIEKALKQEGIRSTSLKARNTLDFGDTDSFTKHYVLKYAVPKKKVLAHIPTLVKSSDKRRLSYGAKKLAFDEDEVLADLSGLKPVKVFNTPKSILRIPFKNQIVSPTNRQATLNVVSGARPMKTLREVYQDPALTKDVIRAFEAGKTPKDIIKEYVTITGRVPYAPEGFVPTGFGRKSNLQQLPFYRLLDRRLQKVYKDFLDFYEN